jgi:hypothetical protein
VYNSAIYTYSIMFTVGDQFEIMAQAKDAINAAILDAGRPKTVRIRNGQHHYKERRCGNCGQLTRHNARTCRAQPCDTLEPEQELELEPVLSYSQRIMRRR